MLELFASFFQIGSASILIRISSKLQYRTVILQFDWLSTVVNKSAHKILTLALFENLLFVEVESMFTYSNKSKPPLFSNKERLFERLNKLATGGSDYIYITESKMRFYTSSGQA